MYVQLKWFNFLFIFVFPPRAFNTKMKTKTKGRGKSRAFMEVHKLSGVETKESAVVTTRPYIQLMEVLNA